MSNDQPTFAVQEIEVGHDTTIALKLADVLREADADAHREHREDSD
jgi:hypothetical protein